MSVSMMSSSSNLRWRIDLMKWAVPLALIVMVLAYQFGLARWIHDRFSDPIHFSAEVLFYATVGPLSAFMTLRLIGNWLDEKERAERQANLSEARLASITSLSADAILAIDLQGNINAWNRGAELLFDYSESEITGKSYTQLFDSASLAGVELSWINDAVQRSGFVQGYEATCRDANGRLLDVELTATGLTSEDDQPIGMSVILRDVTLRKRRDEEIQRLNENLNQQVVERTHQLAEKVEQLATANEDLQKLDQTRSQLVSMVSHQIRAPLTNMQGAVDRMQRDCLEQGPTCNRMFGILEQQIGRLDRLVQGVLQATQIEANELFIQREPVSLLPLVHQVVEQMKTRVLERQIHLPDLPGLPLVYADRDRVSEVLANLLDNADMYSPAGKDVFIEVRANQREVTLSVRDMGAGVPEAEMVRVFEKYYRLDGTDSQPAYGHGLGLFICRQLVEAQGGQIYVENHSTGGAVFSFSLPVWQNRNE